MNYTRFHQFKVMAVCGISIACLMMTSCTVKITKKKTTDEILTSSPTTVAEQPTKSASRYERSNDYHDYESLASLFEPYGFRFGTVIGEYTIRNSAFTDLVKHQFNSMTCENETKAYSMLDQFQSQASENGMPVMNYSKADEIMQFASDNGIAMRGHVLVWDSSMKDWFFREGYQTDGAYVDRETMKKRMEYYITEVVNHFETKFPGLIYCWDVVNEAVGDNENEYNIDDARHLRTSRSGAENLFYEHVGDDYVALAFLYARNAVDTTGADIKLYYNDYNTFVKEKQDAICELITSVNTSVTNEDGSYKKLCDGVGMQGYIGGYGTQEGCLVPEDIERIHTAIDTYAALGLEVQITEMAIRNFDPSEAVIKQHADYYRDLFQMLISVNKEDYHPLTSVSIWSLCDESRFPKGSYQYNLLSTNGGLFTQDYEVKDAYREVYDLVKPSEQ